MSETRQPVGAPLAGQKLVQELKVSGHLMSLDTGLFCFFNPPGGQPPDPATGLPGVRLSLPPGPGFRPDIVQISTFRDDGWVGGWDGAALVRVARGPAQVMVTVYQAPNSPHEAPRLQVLKLSESGGGAAVPPPAVAALPAVPRPIPPPPPRSPAAPPATPAGATATSADAAGATEIVAHVQGRGDVTARLGEWMGVPGSKQWVEGFALSPKTLIGPSDIEYQAVLGRGWLSPWSEGGQFCGSRGMSLPILGLRVRLRGAAVDRFDCALDTSFVDGTKIAPLDNGEPSQAESLAPLEAFRIVITPRETVKIAAPAAAKKPVAARKPAPKPAPAPAPLTRAKAKPKAKPKPKARR